MNTEIKKFYDTDGPCGANGGKAIDRTGNRPQPGELPSGEGRKEEEILRKHLHPVPKGDIDSVLSHVLKASIAAMKEYRAYHSSDKRYSAEEVREVQVIDYNNIPGGEVLILTTSKVWLIGDWYKNGWRTHRSYWVPDGDYQKLFHPLDKTNVTHYCKLPSI